jgi:hypothetical protein
LLSQAEPDNQNKFPVTRRYQDPINQTGLLSVRCAECARLPYKLKEGEPYRSDLIGQEEVTLLPGWNSSYNYWSRGIGHLLEVYTDAPQEGLAFERDAPIEIGFLIEEDVNLIVIAYRFLPCDWYVTPYLWHAHPESERGVPAANPTSEQERTFTVATVDTTGGMYRTIRRAFLSVEFASLLNAAILDQISRGAPANNLEYKSRVEGIWQLTVNDRLQSLLRGTATI